MPSDPKYAHGRLTLHLTELIEYANRFRNADRPLTAMMQQLLIDYNAYAGMDPSGKFRVSDRLTRKSRPRAEKADAEASG